MKYLQIIPEELNDEFRTVVIWVKDGKGNQTLVGYFDKMTREGIQTKNMWWPLDSEGTPLCNTPKYWADCFRILFKAIGGQAVEETTPVR